MATYINGIVTGNYCLVSIADDAYSSINAAVYSALKSLGAVNTLSIDFRS